MRAGQGAISHIRMSRDLATGRLTIECDVIGNVEAPQASAARPSSISSPRPGRLDCSVPRGDTNEELPTIGSAPTATWARGFTVAHGHGNEPIVICEGDVASLLQAKAAVAAGILTLLRQVNITSQNIKTLYLAGGFGMHLDIPNTIALRPAARIPPASRSNWWATPRLPVPICRCWTAGSLTEIRRVAKEIQIVELNLDPEFETTYI